MRIVKDFEDPVFVSSLPNSAWEFLLLDALEFRAYD